MTTPTPTITLEGDTDTTPALPWKVLLWNDPVNTMEYVTVALCAVFELTREKAESMMWQAHTTDRTVVWSGDRDKAIGYAQALHTWQLQATVECDQ